MDREIAKKTGLTLNTLTNMLDKMEKSNLIYREVASEDNFKKIISNLNDGD